MSLAPERIEALRTPPNSVEAEQSVLGGLMLDDRALPKISDWLTEKDFYRNDHRLIYRAINELAILGKPYDAVTMGEWFEANGLSELVGGTSYVSKLANMTPSAANVAAYAEIVREKARLRELIDIGMNIAGDAWKPRADASNVASAAQNALGSLVGDARAGGLVSAKTSLPDFWAQLQRRFERGEHITGLASPFSGLDDITLGWQPGDLIIIAGRPSMGKSVLGEECATYASLQLKHTALFSLEMRHDAITQRQVSRLAKVAHKSLRSPRDILEDEWTRVTAAVGTLKDIPMWIDDQPALSPAQIIARAKRQHLRHALSLVVIDHLHEVRLPGRDRVNELGDAARAFRALGRELGIPVILLVQLNRANVTRTDHRPTLGDLRGSGAIEEVADVVLLIHREDYYDASTHLKKVVEIIIAKGRDLPAGQSIFLRNHFEEMRLTDWRGPLPVAYETKQKVRGGMRPAAPLFGDKDE